VYPTITIDIGTTSVKLIAFDPSGEPLARRTVPTPTRRDELGEVYATAELLGLVDAFVVELPASVRADVRRIAITGVGESGGLVRADGTLASPLVLWHDHRGADRLAALSNDQRARITAVTGLPVNANYGVSKAAWAVDAAGADARGAEWCNVAEYLAATLTARRWSERSLASRTMALDLADGAWSDEICAMFGIDAAVFPELRTASDGEQLLPSRAADLGLSTDVVVHVAGHDHMVGAVGAGLHRGELLNSTGTTEGLLVLRDRPALDAAATSKLANGLACVGDDVTLFASIPTGGSAFATLRSMLDMSASELETCIDGLLEAYRDDRVDLDRVPLVLPRFRGSPPPDKRSTDMGMITGLRSDTTSADIVLGTFLGLALQFRDVLDLFPERPEHIGVIGPATRNGLWLQLKADLLGVAVRASSRDEVVSRGAQAIASGATIDAAANSPFPVTTDSRRHERLGAWAERNAPVWTAMKELR
jgi:sugar (pentulose or hexulose) kinase